MIVLSKNIETKTEYTECKLSDALINKLVIVLSKNIEIETEYAEWKPSNASVILTLIVYSEILEHEPSNKEDKSIMLTLSFCIINTFNIRREAIENLDPFISTQRLGLFHQT